MLLVMVSNDDLSTRQEAQLGYLKPQTAAERFSRIWGLVRLGSHQRPADFTSVVKEVQALDADCRARGAKLAVVVFRNIESDPRWLALLSALEAGLPADGPPVLDLGPALLGRPFSELTVHETDWHPNDVAHGIAAEEILTFLRTHRLLPGEDGLTDERVPSIPLRKQ